MAARYGPSVYNIPAAARGSTTTHRSAITAVDKLVAPTMATVAKNDNIVGVMAAEEHKVTVAAGNVYGSGAASNILTITPTVNKTVDLTIPQVTGATYYDVFYSTDAAPKWVGRVTEAERAAGTAITAVGTTDDTENGYQKVAGKVNIQLIGTGLATTSAPFAVNTAYYPTKSGITALSCAGYKTAIISASLALTDMRSAIALKLIPFISKKDASPAVWYAGTIQDIAPGSAVGYPLYKTFTVDVHDATDMMILVDTISGQGAAVTVYVEFI